MFKSLTTLAAVVLVLGLAACGDEEPAAGSGSTSAAAADGKDTPEGCLAAVKKLFEKTADPQSVDDEPPPECDDLSTEQQEAAVSKAVESALGDLDKELDKLDDATEKELREALKGTPTP
jgi:hypothetical protein